MPAVVGAESWAPGLLYLGLWQRKPGQKAEGTCWQGRRTALRAKGGVGAGAGSCEASSWLRVERDQVGSTIVLDKAHCYGPRGRESFSRRMKSPWQP